MTTKIICRKEGIVDSSESGGRIRQLLYDLASAGARDFNKALGALNAELKTVDGSALTKCRPLTSEQMDELTEKVSPLRREINASALVKEAVRKYFEEMGLESHYLP